jgi:plasmid stabilization system protein ParE
MTAGRFLEAFSQALVKIRENPYRCHPYNPSKELKYEYRELPVKNYTVFYIVAGNTVEIHRVIYSRRDMTGILEGLEN